MIKAVIYEDPFNPSDVFDQHIVTSSLDATWDLYWVDEAKITIPYISAIDDTYWWCDLYEVNGNADKKIFDWYILESNPLFRWWAKMDLILRSKKEFLRERQALSATNYVSTIAGTIIDDLISVYNAKWDNWVVSRDLYTWSTEPVINIKIEIWDNYYDIFDEIASQMGWNWDYMDGKIYFATDIWVDYSLESSVKYVELYYNWKLGQTTNIKDIKPRIISNRKNIVVGIDQNWTKNIQEDLTWGRVYWAIKEDFRDWDLTAKTTSKLQEVNKSQIVYDIYIDSMITWVTKWDKIRVRVEDHVIDKFNMNESMVVIKKIAQYRNWTKRETLTMWLFAIQDYWFVTKINRIKKVLNLKTL